MIITEPENTAVGDQALVNNMGGSNTATGFGSLFSNTTGFQNTANGAQALFANTTGANNTATGDSALQSNTTGDENTANGIRALLSNTTGSENTANGVRALFLNTTGFENTATGTEALRANTTGGANTANGAFALFFNTTGDLNTATGFRALLHNLTGEDNTANGVGALENSAGNRNTALGANTGASVMTASNVICIGANVLGADVSNTCFIGNIRGVTTQNANAIPVLVDSAGQLGTVSSSKRFKNEIKPMDSASESILALKPVTFHYKSDNNETPQFGLIAEEVAEISPDLVVRDDNGEIYTVRYDAVNAMLLNEFLKEHRRVEAQEATDQHAQQKGFNDSQQRV